MHFTLRILADKTESITMKKYLLLIQLITLIGLVYFPPVFAQEEEEPVNYFQMEPLDDSLFIKIQTQVFIDPPDPKAEIIVDLRDPNAQTISIKGTLYPFLAFTPETRAKIVTYPFKINLDEQIGFTSVFTRVFEKMRIGKLAEPPTLTQISSTRNYINPFLQLQGGERFGVPIKNDIGISFGIGTPFSGVLETNMIQANVHILGFFGGMYSSVDALTELKTDNNHNNLYVTNGIQVGYVIPFGNFFQVGYTSVGTKPTATQRKKFQENNIYHYKVKILDNSYFNWELRYPISILGSTRGKFYVAKYLGEMHAGYTGRELSLAGSTFDMRFDALLKSDVRKPQYVLEMMVQKIFESWGFSAFAVGPSVTLSMTDKKEFGVISLFANVRIKVGTSL